MTEKYRSFLNKMSKEDLIRCICSCEKKNFQNLNVNDYNDEDIKNLGFFMLKWFDNKSIGNPFNYNRFLEFVQAQELGYKLLPVGGGSDGINEKGETAEFKATPAKENKSERSYSFTYNGTTLIPTLKEQEIYCYKKIMRDKFHYWTIYDPIEGNLMKTIKLKNEDVWKILWPKWKRSWEKSAHRGDPRIGASISIYELNKAGIIYEVINHL